MRSVLLCRVSSKEQEETGYSLPAQEKLLREYAERKELAVSKVFSISESASGHKQREIFTGMLSFIKQHDIKIIICEKVDRLTRNFKDMVMIDEWLDKDEERQIHLVKDALTLHKNSKSQEKLNWGIRILFAKNYIDNLSEEVKKGQKEKISQGWLPTKPPPGYITTGEKGHKIHLADPKNAPIVKEMFALYLTGNYTTRKLTDTMFAAGLRSSFGNRIPKSRIHTMLTDPFYAGKIKWNNKIYPGKHEPFISYEDFTRIQSILHGKTTPKYTKHTFLFRNLIKCAECGGTITWEVQKGITYGHCNHYRNCSQQTWSKEYEVEDQLVGGLIALQIQNKQLVEWIRKALKESHEDLITYHTTALSELQTKLDIIQKRLDRLYDDKLDEKISEDFYERKFANYTEEKEEIINAISKHSQSNNNQLNLGLDIYNLAQNAPALYQKAKDKKLIDKQRQLLKLVFGDLTINEGKLDFKYSHTFELLKKAVDATNSSKQEIIPNIDNQNFEPKEKIGIPSKTECLYPLRPNWLPR